MVSVHGCLFKHINWTLHTKAIDVTWITKTENSTVWCKTQTRKQSPTKPEWNPDNLSMIFNQRQLTTY
jgi:hypothetical protein